MKFLTKLSNFLWLLIFAASGYFSYSAIIKSAPLFGGEWLDLVSHIMFLVFISGFSLAAGIYSFMLMKTAVSRDAYKRELEKGAVGKSESDSMVKVLESKIEVLEKALENALNK